MLEQLGPKAVAVDAREVGDVVTVALEPPDHRVLGVEHPVLGPGATRGERPVVAHLVGAAGGRAGVEGVAAVLVVGLPGGVRGLEEHVGAAVVVADDERDVARSRGAVLTHQLREVDARDRVVRHDPEHGHRPVAAIDEAGGGGRHAVGLALRKQDRGPHGRDLAGAHARVVAHAVDVDPVGGRGGVDLERDRPALVDADVGREALDRRGAGAADIPLARRVAGLGVLAGDGVGDRHVAGRGERGGRAARERAGHGHRRRQERQSKPEAAHGATLRIGLCCPRPPFGQACAATQRPADVHILPPVPHKSAESAWDGRNGGPDDLGRIQAVPPGSAWGTREPVS